MAVVVNAAANQSPSANAGADKTITLPTTSVTLNGSASDPDGSIISYNWTKVSGPSATISSPSSASTNVTGLAQGSYVFRLTVSDNQGASATDDVLVTVNPQPTSGITRIEAEAYTVMSGVVKETTSDVGCGQSVGYIDGGDWMEYSYTAPSTGSYTLNLRLASPATGGQLQVRKGDGTVLATVNVPNTGGWQSWQTIPTTLSLSQGPQTLRLVSTSAQYKGWNINWLELSATGSATITQRRITTISEQLVSSLELFPNPITEHTVLKINNSLSGNVTVQIINMNGSVQREFRLYKEKGIMQTKLGTGNLPAGSYNMKLTMDGWNDSKQIIKQ